MGTWTVGSAASYGWNDTGNYSGGALSIDDQQFRYGYETFNLKAIDLNGGTLTLEFDADGAGDISSESTRDKLELHIVSTGSTKVLNFSAGNYSASGRSVVWSSTSLSWLSGNEIDLKIAENDATPPALVRPHVRYNVLDLQFSEDLVWYPRPDTSAFAVTVDGVSRNVASLSIDGAKGIVKLRLALPAQAGEAVVVSYTPPATSPIQDLAGNAAAGFSVTIPASVTGTAPAAPDDLTATVGNAHVTLKWTTPDNGGKTITGFEYRQKEGTGSFGTWRAIPNSGPYTTSYTVPNLDNGTEYTFEVRAKNAAGDSASASASGTPSMSETDPPVLEYAYKADEELRLVFDEVLDSDSVPAASAFTVTVDDVSSDVIEVVVDGANRMVRVQISPRFSFFQSIDIAYTPPATNPIKDLAGNSAAGFTTEETSPLKTVPDAPRNLTAQDGTGYVTLKWWWTYDGGVTIAGYEYRQKEGTGSFGNWMVIPNSGPNTKSYTVSALTNGTDYTFEVRAVNGVGKGPAASASGTPAVITTSAPAAPKFTGLFIDDGKLTVVGSLSLGTAVPVGQLSSVVSSFKVQWKSGSQGYDSSREAVLAPKPASVSGAHSTAFVPSHAITGLTNGVEYSVRIIASNAYGDSPPSVERTGTPNSKPDQLRQYIEDEIVKKHESSYPWLRHTWDYMKSNNVRLSVRNYGSSNVSSFCRDSQGLSSCYVSRMTITTDVLDGDAAAKKRTILHELAHVYTLANDVSATPAPIAMAHLYFGSLNGQGCSSKELYADILASLVLGGSMAGGSYWNSCAGASDTATALAVVRSAAGGQAPSWFASSYNDSNGNLDLEQVWADLIGVGGVRTAMAYQLRRQFGGYCDKQLASKAIRSNYVERAVTRNPWKDGGCVPGAPASPTATSAGGGQVVVSWEAPATDGGSRIRGYRVEWKSGDDDDISTGAQSVWFSPWESYRPSEVAKTIDGLTNGFEHTFKVLAFNQNGDGAATEVKATPSETDAAAPVLLTATAERTDLVLTYNEALDETSIPAASAYTVNVGGTARSVNDVSVEDSEVTLILSSKVASSDAVTLTYAVPTDANASRIQDAAGNDAAALSAQTVTNNTPPVSSDATLNAMNYAYTDKPCNRERREDCPRRWGGLGTYLSNMSMDVGSAVDTITFWPDPANDQATVAYSPADANSTADGYQLSLSPGDNVVTITVTAEDGVAIKTYSITVTRTDNSPARGVVAISGMVRAGETLTVSLFGIVDLNGLTNPTFSYQWVSNDGNTDADIQNATNSTYTLATTDVGKTITVRVTFTDDESNTETLTSAATIPVEPAASEANVEEPLTASFESRPDAHDGSIAFTLGLRFSEEIAISDVAMRDEVLQVSGGSVTDAERSDPTSTRNWQITVAPDGDGDVFVLLTTGRACNESGAICTSGGKRLLNGLAVLVSHSALVVNTPASGLPTVSGTARVGETLTASVTGITDAGGLNGTTFAYQWVSNDGRDDSDIENATEATYTVATTDVGKTIKVRVTFRDDGDTEATLVSVATATVAPEAAAALPEVSIRASSAYTGEGADTVFTLTRSARISEALTVPVSVEETGAMLGAPVPTNMTFAAGEPETEFRVPTADDELVEADSVVTARIESGSGHAVDEESASASVTVLDDDNAPSPVTTGVTVWSADMVVVDYETGAIGAASADLFSNQGGTAGLEAKWLWYYAPGHKLRVAFTSSIPDAEGLTLHLGDVVIAVPEGRSGESGFNVSDLDLDWSDGETIAVRLMKPLETPLATDASLQSLTVSDAELSPAFDAEVLVYTAVVGSATESLTVTAAASDGDAEVSFGPSEDGDAEQQGHQVAVPYGETLITVTVIAAGEAQRSYRVVARRARPAVSVSFGAASYTATEGGEPAAVVVRMGADPGRDVTIPLTAAPVGDTGGEDYTVVESVTFTSGGALSQTVEMTAVPDDEAEDDQSVVLGFGSLPEGAEANGTTSATVALVDGSGPLAPVNTAPTGLPTITGTARVGETLTASVADIADVDGLTTATFAYQWIANDGTDDTEIESAMDSTYTPAAANAGKAIKVRVTFTDDGGTEETLVSKATAAVNTPPTGLPAITGTAQVGETLTASVTDIADPDGLTRVTFAYRWVSNDGSSDTDIQGETEPTYTLVASDEGKTIKVRVSFTDDGGTKETLTSTATAEVVVPLTAAFEGVPADHDGSSIFTFRVRFNPEPRVSYKVLRDESFTVSGGTVRRARRVNGRNDLREIHVEPSGYGDVTITLAGGRACGTHGAICTADGRVLSNTLTATVQGPPSLSVSDTRAEEGTDETIDFVVTLSRAASETVTVDYATSDGSATAGDDYTATSDTLTFSPGETSKTVAVRILDDAVDEGEETLTLTLSNPSGAWIEDGEATGTIENNDPLPKAWTARFGRSVAIHVLGALEERLDTPSRSYVRLGGHQLGGGLDVREAVQRLTPDRNLWEESASDTPGQDMTVKELLLGSAFNLASNAEDKAIGPRLTAWGQVATSGFDGEEDRLSLNGTVTTATLGVDGHWEHWLTGVALAYSEGDGSFTQVEAEGGDVDSTLTSIHPYVAYALSDRVRLWGMVGYGSGSLQLRLAEQRALDTDLAMTMGALGVRGSLREPSQPEGGLALALRSDVLWLRYTSAWGLSIEASVRGLLAHEASDYREWGASGALRFDPGRQGRGLTASIVPTWGSAATGGRLDAELGYGLVALQGRGLLTPYVRAALAEGDSQAWHLGARLALASSLNLSLEASRRAREGEAAAHEVALLATLGW